MLYGLTLILLMDPAIGLAPQRAAEQRPLTHFDNYTEAYRIAQQTKKPLLVILNPGDVTSTERVLVEDVRKTQHRRKLLEKFVVVVIDTSTEHGATIHKLFDHKPLPHVAVIDRDQKWQVFRTSRKLQGEDWTRILETFQNGDHTASLNLDARPMCPT